MKRQIKLMLSVLLMVSTFVHATKKSIYQGEIPNIDKSTIEVKPSVVDKASNSAIIKVTLRDSSGYVIEGADISRVQEGAGDLATMTPIVEEARTGKYTFKVVYNNDSEVDVDKYITITANNVEFPPVVITYKAKGLNVEYGTPNASNSSITIDKSEITADNNDFATVTVKVRDAENRAVKDPNMVITMSDTFAGTQTDTDAVFSAVASDTEHGIYTYRVKSSVALSDVQISAHIVGHDSNGNVAEAIDLGPVMADFVSGPIAQTSMVASPTTVVADGVAFSTITVSVKDINDNPINDATVTLSQNGAAHISNVTKHDDGTYTFTTTSTTAQNVTYSAKVNNITSTNTVTVHFTAGTPNASKSTIVATPTRVLANGVAKSTITVTAKDANNNLITNATVRLSENGSAYISNVVNHHNGTYTFTTTATTAQNVVYTASINNLKLNNTAKVTFYNVTPVYRELTPAMLGLYGFTNHRTGSVDVSHYFGLPANSIRVSYASVDVRRTNTGHTTFTLAGGQDQYGDWRVNYSTSHKIKVSHGGTLGGRAQDIFIAKDAKAYQFNGLNDYRLRYSENSNGYYIVRNPKKRKVFSNRSFEWTAKTFATSYAFTFKTTAPSGYHKGSDYKIFVDVSH